MKEYSKILQHFKRDTEHHSLEILNDQGLYRHLRMSNNGSSIYFYDIVTWPGYLTISGDMGCYTFSRISDMFPFFRSNMTLSEDSINVAYWTQKLDAVDKHNPVKEWKSESAYAEMERTLIEWIEENPCELSEEDLKYYVEEVRSEIVFNWEDEHEWITACRDFNDKYNIFGIWEGGMSSVTEYGHNYIWCLYAIVKAISMYDHQKEVLNVSDN